MKQNTNSLKKQIDEIALAKGFYKSEYKKENCLSNFRDPVLPLIISVYATSGTVGVSYDKKPFKWYKKCSIEQIKKIFENPIKYS